MNTKISCFLDKKHGNHDKEVWLQMMGDLSDGQLLPYMCEAGTWTELSLYQEFEELKKGI